MQRLSNSEQETNQKRACGPCSNLQLGSIFFSLSFIQPFKDPNLWSWKPECCCWIQREKWHQWRSDWNYWFRSNNIWVGGCSNKQEIHILFEHHAQPHVLVWWVINMPRKNTFALITYFTLYLSDTFKFMISGSGDHDHSNRMQHLPLHHWHCSHAEDDHPRPHRGWQEYPWEQVL